MAHSLIRSVSVRELAAGLHLSTNSEGEVHSIGSLEEAAVGRLCFEKDPGACTVAGAVVLGAPGAGGGVRIDSLHPRLDFIRALSWLNDHVGFVRDDSMPEIHPSVTLGRNVVIEAGCRLAEGVVVEHNAVIQSGTRIGARTLIRANASIGGDGFGFERDEAGRPVKFPHLGGVSIGADVEIGSNTCIARGTLGDTVIEDGAKIDNLVHIAHNCHIGRESFVIACAEVSGGVRIGARAWVGPNACILQKLEVGEEALIGLGAVVVKPVEARTVVAGNPARFMRAMEKPE